MSRPGRRAEEYLVEIRRYFQDSLGGAPLDLLDDDPLLGDFLDSIAVLTLATHLESRYGISVRGHEVDSANFGTLRALASYIERKTALLE
jgi:acyl carrier protein